MCDKIARQLWQRHCRQLARHEGASDAIDKSRCFPIIKVLFVVACEKEARPLLSSRATQTWCQKWRPPIIGATAIGRQTNPETRMPSPRAR